MESTGRNPEGQVQGQPREVGRRYQGTYQVRPRRHSSAAEPDGQRVVEIMGNEQYLVKVHGSGRVTRRNRSFLRKYKTIPHYFGLRGGFTENGTPVQQAQEQGEYGRAPKEEAAEEIGEEQVQDEVMPAGTQGAPAEAPAEDSRRGQTAPGGQEARRSGRTKREPEWKRSGDYI